MKKTTFFFLFAAFLFASCTSESTDLPAPDTVMVKFVNKTGKHIEGLVVSKVQIGDLGKGKTTEAYHRYELLGQQFGFALVEAVGTIDGKLHFTASACQGVCGTESAPNGTWLEPAYYKISIHLSTKEKNALEFRMMD